MATGGARRKGKRLDADDEADNMKLTISPQEARCPYHPGEVRKLFCFDCQATICQDCIVEAHRKHDINSLLHARHQARSKLFKLKPEVELLKISATRRSGEATHDLAALQNLVNHRMEKGTYKETHMTELHVTTLRKDEAEREEVMLGGLLTDLDNLVFDTNMNMLLELTSRVQSTLKNAEASRGLVTVTDEQVQKLSVVAKKALMEIRHGRYYTQVAIVPESLDALEDMRGGLQSVFPSPDQVYKAGHVDYTVVYIPNAIGKELASLLGISHPPEISCAPNAKFTVLKTGDQPSHCIAHLYKYPEKTGTEYWLPTSLTIREAVNRATGTDPTKLMEAYRNQDVELHITVRQWLSSVGSDHLVYWPT